MKSTSVACAIVSANLISILFWRAADSATADDLAARCPSLVETDFSMIADAPTQILSAQVIEPKDAQPGYCKVIGYVSPQVGFELHLPIAAWNGKFLQVGSGGHAGHLDPISWCPADRAYACLVSDMGHKGNVRDGLWADRNLQAKVDWGFRATHVATLAGKAITQHYYQQAPRKSYFMGCSTGGRQALQEAQRFPWDFDGILAGAPPVDLSITYMTLAWGIRATHTPEGKPLLTPQDLQLLSDSATAKCDADDGVKDGVIGDPLQCSFDPAALACKAEPARQCLSPAQIEAVKKVYAGPMNSRGEKLTLGGPLAGSESGNWIQAYLGIEGQPSFYEPLVSDGFRYLFFWPEPGPTWKINDFDFDRDYQRMGLMQFLVDSTNPDLRRFKAAGGKLLIYQGTNDISILPRSTIDYYDTVERTMGGREATQDFLRLFILPGMNHCAGGVGADAVDFLGHLEAWVERGQAPDRILSGRLKQESPPKAYPYRPFPADASQLKFTRPVYPYPTKAKYRGHGDPNDAASFEPVQP